MTGAAAVAAALAPVLVFLGLLQTLDSFKLVAARTLLRALVGGAGAAVLCLPLNTWIIEAPLGSPAIASRYIAPVVEETAKVAVVAALVWSGGAAFLVDAAILGFGAGAGFALIENLHYLWALPGSSFTLWFVRGFGTAVLHGATTAVAAILLQHARERRPHAKLLNAAPGLALAVAIHSGFNHFILPPAAATLLLLVALPPLVLYVFERSERATREWVHGGMDVDVDALTQILSSDFGGTRAGIYLRQLQSRFPGPVVADMFCLLRLDLELAIRARGILMARDAGLEVPVDAGLTPRLEERRYLKRQIGQTGLLALRPLQPASARNDWSETLLRASAPITPRHIDQ